MSRAVHHVVYISCLDKHRLEEMYECVKDFFGMTEKGEVVRKMTNQIDYADWIDSLDLSEGCAEVTFKLYGNNHTDCATCLNKLAHIFSDKKMLYEIQTTEWEDTENGIFLSTGDGND